MKIIKITQNKVSLVDDEDFEFLNKIKWNAVWNGKKWYAQFHPKNGVVLWLHRYVLNYTGPLQVDHVDGNGINNQKENLRLATNSQNQMNRPASKTASSGYKGVTYDSKAGKWRA